MRLSLITVCLNSEHTIIDTINSVLAQDFREYEHIVFDGGSTDKTLDIIKSFGDKVRLIQGNDTGIFDAMNQAMRQSKGDILGIINSDDFYAHSKVLSKVLSTFAKYDTDTVYGDLLYVKRDNLSKVHRNWRSGEFRHSKFKYGWTVPHPTFFVKKEVYSRCGFFNDAFKISGDYELILRLLYLHKVSTSYIPEVLVKMRSGGNSDGNINKRLDSLKEDYQAWKINDLNPAIYTIPLKPLRKLRQFF